jgi:hypothetical protein
VSSSCLPFNLGLITNKHEIPEPTAPNPTNPLVMFAVLHSDKVNNLAPACPQWIKSSGKKAPLKMQKLEIILHSPMAQNLVCARIYTPEKQKDAYCQSNADGEVSKYLNGGLLIHAQ